MLLRYTHRIVEELCLVMSDLHSSRKRTLDLFLAIISLITLYHFCNFGFLGLGESYDIELFTVWGG